MTNVLVTGAGMVGTEIARQLHEDGQRPVLLDLAFHDRFLDTVLPRDAYERVEGDVTDRELIDRVLGDHSIDQVVHTAAVLPMRVGHAAHPGFFKVNTWGTTNLMFAARDAGVRRFVFFSTNGVYQFKDTPVEGPVSEDFPTGLTRANAYGNSKAVAESTLHELTDQGALDGKIIRPGEIYGPLLYRGQGGHRVYWKEMVDAAIDGRPFMMCGEPAHRLDWIYSKDVARLACRLLQVPSSPHVAYNASFGRVHGIQEIQAALDEAFPGHQVELVDCGETGWDHPLDNSRAREDLDFVPRFDLESGIQDYAQWFKSHGLGRGAE